MRQPNKNLAPTRQVILLDEGWIATLYVAVGLRNAGCDVRILTPAGEREDVKFLGPRISLEVVPSLRSTEYIPALEASLASRPSASVLALTEQVLYRLWSANPPWLPRVHPRCAPWQKELLRNKTKLSAYVSQVGVRIPAQRTISSLDCITDAIRDLGLPVVAKGAAGHAGLMVRIAHTEEEARHAAAEFMKEGDCFLQQYIEGPTYLAGGLFHDGEPIRIYAAEIFERAHRTGPSFRHRSINDAALLDTALGVFRALRWTGLAQVDLARGLDGKCYFIEFNPRPWGSIGAAARTGVDMFGPLAELLEGRKPITDLSSAEDVYTTMFPQVAAQRLRAGRMQSFGCLLREPRIWLNAPWSDPGLALHLARTVWWSWRNGAAGRLDNRPAPWIASVPVPHPGKQLPARRTGFKNQSETDSSPAPGRS